MDSNLIAKSLCFHGQPLQKIWEGERGSSDLYKLGITNPDFSVYTIRQKNLTFQDRAKRLKLHQFIAKKAATLFDGSLTDYKGPVKYKDKNAPGTIAMPPYESFLSKTIDKTRHLHQILEVIQPGDIIYGVVLQRSSSGLLVKTLCTGEPICRYLADVTIKAFVLSQNMIPALDKRGNQKPYMNGDYICCEVLEISADADRMNLGMKGTLTIDEKAPLGLITIDQMPEYYKRTVQNQDVSFTDLLENSENHQNPGSVDNLFQEVGLAFGTVYSNMNCLKYHFPQQEYAHELRQIQASKWAFRSVADGIEHFKVGKHTEAFQCLNKALTIDPRNVEGLVARGALYANSGSFKKAVDDFETALKLNPYHANARKYMGETLVALGRSYEEENRIDEARKAYKDCLNIIPHHEEAKSSLEFLNGKTNQMKQQLINANELMPPPGYEFSNIDTVSKDTISSTSTVSVVGSSNKKCDDTSLSSSSFKKEKTSKKKKKDKPHHHHKRKNESKSSDDSDSNDNSSNNSSSNSSDTESSDGNSTTDSYSSSANNKRKFSKKYSSSSSNDKYKQSSLSPLSKRMIIMDEQNNPTPMGALQSSSSSSSRYQFNQPFHLASSSVNNSNMEVNLMSGGCMGETMQQEQPVDDYDIKVKNFLEMTRDEDDYEYRVRNLIEEVTKYRKERKVSGGNSKKKDKKKDSKKKQKKLKKDSKKSKKKSKNKEKSLHETDDIDNMDLKEALKIVKSIPMLDFEKKLTTGDTQSYKNFEISHRDVPSTSSSADYEFSKKNEQLTGKNRGYKSGNVSNVKEPSSPPRAPPFPRNNFAGTSNEPKPTQPLITPPKAPIVLDKFGCFRLAAPEEKLDIPKRSVSPSSRGRYGSSRSRSRSNRSRSRHRRESSRSSRRSRSLKRYSRSRSRSHRSLRREHSRNSARRSPRRTSPRRRSSRHRSRSQGRSFSRRSRTRYLSRSRSRSVHRHRSRSPIKRRSRSIDFAGGSRRRQSFSRSPSFNRSRSRSPWRRGRGRGGFRGRGFFPYRGRGRGRGNFRGRRSPFFKNRNFSRERSLSQHDDDDTKPVPKSSNKGWKDGIEGKWTHDKYEKSGSNENDAESKSNVKTENEEEEENWDDNDNNPEEPSVEEIDKIINKAQKERKEEILQRDKSLLKKSTQH